MTLKTCMRTAALAVVCAAAIAGHAAAAPQALSPWDAKRYAAAFAAVERGDFIEAQLHAAGVKDKALAGQLVYEQLMHPTAHRASYEELSAWLADYADLPGAERVYALAMKRKPAGAAPPRAPVVSAAEWSRVEKAAQGVAGRLPADKARAAREAFYSGDVKRALTLAEASGEAWIAGLAAYRLANYAQAERHFARLARDAGQDPWQRAAAAFWAARSAGESGDLVASAGFLRTAAAYPDTFYGMIAARQVRLQAPEAASAAAQRPAAATGEVVRVSNPGAGAGAEVGRFIKTDPRARRAAALAQIGLLNEAGLELRAGLALAKTKAEREQWSALVLALNAPLTSHADVASSRPGRRADYPTPVLEPKWGFTVDKALVYAIVHQESRFNPQAVSPVGAVGLMQLMPEAAARAAGDDKLKSDMSPLFDPAFNLRVGQDYLVWLMDKAVGHDILRAVAAYNGGPGTLTRTAQMLGEDADPLLLIECLPSLETREYVEKVMAAYWTYRAKFGQESRTLDALAAGARFIDARWDQ